MMLWALLTSHVLAEISMGGLIFVAFFLVVWGAIAISSIKAAKNSQVTRVAPPPLASGQGYERRVLPKVGPVGVRQTGVRQTGVRQTGVRQTGVRQTGVRQTGGLPRRPIPGVAVPLPPLSTMTKTAAMQRAAMKGRGVRSGKPGVKSPVGAPASQGGQVASVVSRIASPTRTAISTSAQVRSAVSSFVNVKTLRSQFLLAEALRPPVALREEQMR